MHRLVLRSALFLPRVRIGIAFSFSKSNPSKFTKKNPTVSYDTSTDKELANRVYSCHKLKIESDDAPHFQLAEDLYRTFKEHNHHQRSTKSIDYWLKEHAELIRAISMKKPALRESLNKQAIQIWSVNHGVEAKGYRYDKIRTFSYFTAMTALLDNRIVFTQAIDKYLSFLKELPGSVTKKEISVAQLKWLCSSVFKFGTAWRNAPRFRLVDLDEPDKQKTLFEVKERLGQTFMKTIIDCKPVFLEMIQTPDCLTEWQLNLLMQGLGFLSYYDLQIFEAWLSKVVIYPEISSQTLGIVSQVIMLNCTQFFSNGEKQPVVLQKVLASIRDHLIRNAGNPDMVDQAGFAYIVFFKYAQFGKDPQLVKVFTQTMLVYLQQLKKIWTFVQPSKLFTFCSPSIIQTEEMKPVLELFVDIATKMVSNCLKAMKDKVFEHSAAGILHEYGGIRPELKELYYTGQVLRVLISAGQLGVLEQIPISQIVEFLELVGQTLPQDATASNFVNSMYLSVLYSLKSNPTFSQNSFLATEREERTKKMMGYRIEFLTDVNDRPETHLKDKIVRIPEQIGNLFPNAKIQTEVPIESLLCDFVIEIPTDEFMSVFGNDSLTTDQKKMPHQTYLLEIHGPAHYCTVTGEIDLKTSHKLETWRQLGWHIGYLTSTELSATAKLHVDTTAELKKILQARLKWTMKDGPHTIKLEV